MRVTGPRGLILGSSQSGSKILTYHWDVYPERSMKVQIEGVGGVNPMTFQPTRCPLKFEITKVERSTDKLAGCGCDCDWLYITPALVESGQYQNVTALPLNGAKVTVVDMGDAVRREEKVMQQGIPGVPLGTKIKSLYLERLRPGLAIVQLEPDNIYGVLDLTTVPIGSGHERVGETIADWFRMPKVGEWFVMGMDGQVLPCYTDWSNAIGDLRRIIVQPVKPKMKRVLVIEAEDPSPGLVTELTATVWGNRASLRWEERPTCGQWIFDATGQCVKDKGHAGPHGPKS